MNAGFITFAGRDVFELRMAMPRVGVWWAHLALADSDEPPSGAQTLNINGLEFVCWVKRATVTGGTPVLLVAGGAANLSAIVPAKSYRETPVNIILGDVLSAAKEHLSPTSDTATLTKLLAAYSGASRTAGEAIATLVAQIPGAAWRLLPDGSLWVGQESWRPANVDDVEVLDIDVLRRRMLLFAPVPAFYPGGSYQGAHIDYVEHTLKQGVLRTELTFVEWVEGLTQ